MILCVCPNPSVDTYWWMEDIKPGSVNRVTKQAPYPGGKGVHVALNIAELGEEVLLLGIWAGEKGKWIQHACNEKNVATGGIEVKGENRVCITVMSGNDHIANTEFIESGPVITAMDYAALLTLFRKKLTTARIVVLSGSWPQGAPEDAYGAFIDEANEKNIPTWIDCSGDLLLHVLPHKPFGIHLNKEEAEALNTDGTAVKEYLFRYVKQTALTAGKDGLYFSNGIQSYHALFKVNNVISTVGCGDALLAGIVTASVKKLPLEAIARYGAAAGAANCLRPELGMIYKSDVENILTHN